MAVVDPQLRVRGVERLRAIDASVMPTIASGNINPGVLMGRREGRRPHQGTHDARARAGCNAGIERFTRDWTADPKLGAWLRDIAVRVK